MNQVAAATIVNKIISTVFAIAFAICLLFPVASFSQTTLEWIVLSAMRWKTFQTQNAQTSNLAPTFTVDEEQCENGSWWQFNDTRVLDDQGDCIQFVNTDR